MGESKIRLGGKNVKDFMVANDGKFFALSNSQAHTLVLSDEELLKRRGLFHWSTIISAMWDGYAPWAEAKDAIQRSITPGPGAAVQLPATDR